MNNPFFGLHIAPVVAVAGLLAAASQLPSQPAAPRAEQRPEARIVRVVRGGVPTLVVLAAPAPAEATVTLAAVSAPRP
ncbi:MAG TPA: hypothetical protein VF121_11785 [Thermoanaerobaculia bacterium]|nr:hypothetical protein [Thermoanaerobaculia bacterium]